MTVTFVIPAQALQRLDSRLRGNDEVRLLPRRPREGGDPGHPDLQRLDSRLRGNDEVIL